MKNCYRPVLCPQVTMGSMTTNHLVWVWVEEPRAELEGGAERHLEEGSSIRLLCRVNTALPPPAFVFWYKEDTMVNYDYTGRSDSPTFCNLYARNID